MAPSKDANDTTLLNDVPPPGYVAPEPASQASSPVPDKMDTKGKDVESKGEEIPRSRQVDSVSVGKPLPEGTASGVPPETVQGQSNFVFDSNTPLYYPPDATAPVFLGATKGHQTIAVHCGRCNYQGPSEVKRKRGVTNAMLTGFTLGISLLVPLDTHHYCPNCGNHIALAKYF